MDFISGDDIPELIVSRMKLRMRYSDSTAPIRFDNGVIFNFRFSKTLLCVDGIDNFFVYYSDNSPLITYSVPIELPLNCRGWMTAMIDALAKMNVDEEFKQDISTHVLNYASGYTDSSFSIDVDIKVVSGSYLVCEEEAFDWSYVEDENEKLTRSLFVHEDDTDYSIVLLCPIRSYAKLPCGNLCHVKAIAYSCNDVTEAERCSICLHDFLPCNDDNSSSVLMMTTCHHLFHQQCIAFWLTRKNASTCPLCRHTIQIYDFH